MQRRPNFFLVGAPKCGTTSLTRYLAPHPDVFICTPRETNHFCTDLDINPAIRIGDRDTYLRLFRSAGEAKVLTDASVWYLYSRDAARNIHEFNQGSKILIMLRHPVDMLWSLHGWFLYTGEEDIVDFEEALAAEDDRRAGRRLPADPVAPQVLLYSEVVDYAPQVQRYFSAFGRERVKVILFDDFKSNTRDEFQGVLEFLDVDTTYEADFRVHGAAKEIRNPGLKRFIKRHRWLQRGVSSVLPERTRGRIGRTLAAVKPRRPQRATSMDPALRRQLTEQFQPNVQQLAALLDRDLSCWMQDA